MEYKISKYNYARKVDKNKTLIFNGASSACVVLDNESFSKYNSLDINVDIAPTLIEQGFWVNKEEIEEFRFDAYKQSNLYTDTKNKNIVIAPTLRCNARCYYCYEQGRETPTMSQKIVEQTIEFLVSEAKNCESLNISWFGGEPLLAINVIDKIMHDVKERIETSTIFTCSMTTNGALLSDYVIDKMKNEWNLKNIQITIDGCKDYYEKVKDYRNGKDNFGNIIKNIKKLISTGIEVLVRLNISKDNVEELLSLIDYIKEEIGTPKNFDFVAMSLFDFGEEDNRIPLQKEIKKYCGPVFMKMYNSGYWQNGLQSVLRSRALPCAAVKKDFYCIDPLGYLYKCQHYLCNPNASVGNVEEGVFYNKEFCKWCSSKVPTKCMKCKYLPICQGGCKQMKNPCTIVKYLMPTLLDILYLQEGGEKNASDIKG